MKISGITPIIKPINNTNNYKITEPGEYLIANGSVLGWLQIFGGTNSTMYFELAPLSCVRVIAQPEITITGMSSELCPISIGGPYPITDVPNVPDAPINPTPDSYMLKGKTIYIDAVMVVKTQELLTIVLNYKKKMPHLL